MAELRLANQLSAQVVLVDQTRETRSGTVVHAGGSREEVVVHKSKHGVHLKTEERKAYRREWMRKRRMK
jgi:hypothetical protein